MKIIHLLFILICTISLFSCMTNAIKQEQYCQKNEKSVYSDENEGFAFVAEDLFCQLDKEVPDIKSWQNFFYKKQKNVYIHWIRNTSTGTVLDTQEFKQKITKKFDKSKKFSIIDEKQADYIIQPALFKSNTDADQKKYVLNVTGINSKNRLVNAVTKASFSSIDTTPREAVFVSPKRYSSKLEAEASSLDKNEEVSSEYFNQLEVSQSISRGYALSKAGKFEEADKIYKNEIDKLLEKKDRPKNPLVELYEESFLNSFHWYQNTDKKEYFDSAMQSLKKLIAVQIEFDGRIDSFFNFKIGSYKLKDGQKDEVKIKAIAMHIEEKNLCLAIIGHTSCSGSVDHNCSLSKNRAETIKKRITEHYHDAKTKMISRGRAFFEAIDGRHNDNLPDVESDRRVDFNFTPCDTLTKNFQTCENEYQSMKAKGKKDKCDPPKM
ncbi:MAG: OmpA family protein [Candidatus Parabeggiatoa sp.]|nr:OmpA family protein [Candidatus Parabeggiatoa sp.]